MAADAFAVMRDGMKGKVGVGKLALYGREYLVAVRPKERGIVMHTLHHAAEIRSIDAVEELNSVADQGEAGGNQARKPGDRHLRRPARSGRLQGRVSRSGLQQIIDAKIAGEEVVAPAVEAPPKVVNLMDALQEEPGHGEQREEETGEGRVGKRRRGRREQDAVSSRAASR